VKEMDSIAAEIDQKVIIQTGFTNYKPENAEWFDFVEESRIKGYYKNADVIVTHGGAGSLLDCLKYSPSIIVVPRLKKYNEHLDDQQIDLALALQIQGKVTTVLDTNELKHELENRLNPELQNELKPTPKNKLETETDINLIKNNNNPPNHENNKNLVIFLENYLKGTE